MRVFVTGATGFIGSSIVRDLQAAGHDVTGLVRSDANARALAATGATVLRGALEDLDSLRRGAAESDGVIHTAFIHDFKDFAAAGKTDQRAVETMGAALAGSDRPLVIASGIAVLPPGRIGKEDDEPNRNSPGVHRIVSEDILRALASQGVRGSVIRLPPTVHGEGDHGFVPMLVNKAREQGAAGYVGDGSNRWPAVHRHDAARVFRLALEKGAPGSIFHAVAEEGVAARDIADAIGRGLQLPSVSVPPDAVESHFGWLGHFFSLDIPALSARTREQLGWQPTHPTLLEDLAGTSYFAG